MKNMKMLFALVCVMAAIASQHVHAMQSKSTVAKTIKKIDELKRIADEFAPSIGQELTPPQRTMLTQNINSIKTCLQCGESGPRNARGLLKACALKWRSVGFAWIGKLITDIETEISKLENPSTTESTPEETGNDVSDKSEESDSASENHSSNSRPTGIWAPSDTPPSHGEPSFMQQVTHVCSTHKWLTTGLIVGGIIATYLAWSTWRTKKEKKSVHQPTPA